MKRSTRYKLLIAYEGTNYCGWQVQPNALSIQELVEAKLAIFLKERVKVVGAGRTDAGVHAKGQVAHFDFEGPFEEKIFLRALSGLLPADVRVMGIEVAEPDFHARFSAKIKEYHYHLYLDPVIDPFARRYCWRPRRQVNVGLLREAATIFLGTHDFTSFANEPSAGAVLKSPVRTLKRLDVVSEDGGVRLEFESEGFLYKMVRNLVGTLVEVATGRRPLQDVERILAVRDRRQAGQAAPPQGLFLIQISY